MLYSAVLVSAIQQCESAISIYIYLLPFEPPIGYLFYSWKCIYVNTTLSIDPTFSSPPSCCVHKSVHSVCISIPALQIGSLVLFRFFFFYVEVCFPLRKIHRDYHIIESSKFVIYYTHMDLMYLRNAMAPHSSTLA